MLLRTCQKQCTLSDNYMAVVDKHKCFGAMKSAKQKLLLSIILHVRNLVKLLLKQTFFGFFLLILCA